MNNYQNYLKGIVAVLGAVLTALAPYAGSAHWYPVVTAVVTAVAVVLVPNIPSKLDTPEPTTPVMPVPPTV